MKLTFHPLANIFPLMEGVEFESLVEDIRLHGQREPIIVHDGQILDGRNRWHACLKLNVVPKTVEWDGTGAISELIFSTNIHRRHLNHSQKAMVAVKIMEALQPAARRRSLLNLNFAKKLRPKDGAQRLGESSELAGRALGVSGRYVTAAKTLLKRDPELAAQVFQGTLTLSKASRAAQTGRFHQHTKPLRADRPLCVFVQIKELPSGRKLRLAFHGITADAVVEVLEQCNGVPA